MAVKTLGELVTDVRAEAGHALTASQGLNAVETLKHILRRTQEELWVAFQWPQLQIRADLQIVAGQTEYAYPAELQFEQIRAVYYAQPKSHTWLPVQYGIPEDAILPEGIAAQKGTTIEFWETTAHEPPRIRIWPEPVNPGYMRLKGMKPLKEMVDTDDYCTLDATAITLFAAEELLIRAKAADAQAKGDKAQRHLKRLLGNQTSAKMKITTFGAQRSDQYNHGLRPGLDYIPMGGS
jgi:hypothetical protein